MDTPPSADGQRIDDGLERERDGPGAHEPAARGSAPAVRGRSQGSARRKSAGTTTRPQSALHVAAVEGLPAAPRQDSGGSGGAGRRRGLVDRSIFTSSGSMPSSVSDFG